MTKKKQNPSSSEYFVIFWPTIFRSIEEFTNYFAAFSEMREVVALQADAVVNVTKESVKRKSEEKVKLEIVVDTPVIVVPASTNSSQDFFSFKLGMSKKGNSFNSFLFFFKFT